MAKQNRYFSFDCPMPQKDILAAMDKEGFRPATTIEEFLAHGDESQRISFEFGPDDYVNLNYYYSGRIWDAHCRFLAVSKSE